MSKFAKKLADRMKKDFQKWHNKKAQVDDIEKRPFFHEQEIWHCHLGLNIGFEQDGFCFNPRLAAELGRSHLYP